jgi:hypothetical protein
MIQLTRITSNNCPMTKTFSVDEHGKIQSSALAHMTEGRADITEIEDVKGLPLFLDLLLPNQAITAGVPSAGNCTLTTRAGAEFNPEAVARTNEQFRYPFGPTLFPFDVDIDGDKFRTVADVLDALEACHPWLRYATRIARPSSSSYVGARGLRGVHVYLAIAQGADTATLKKRVQIEQWAKGQGSIKISKSGALLVRQLSDDLVYQPSRLMFESQPVLEGVTRDIPEDSRYLVRNRLEFKGRPPAGARLDGMLDVEKLPPMTGLQERQFTTAVRAARAARLPAAKQVALNYQIQNAIAQGYDAKEGERYGLIATRILGGNGDGNSELPTAWPIAVRDVGIQTVQQILDAGDDAIGFQCADPFDSWRVDLKPSDYTKAEIVSMHGTPGIWSHKLQKFFAFSTNEAMNLASPLDQAAEKLCGVIDYPERVGKRAAPLVNIRMAIDLLIRESGLNVRYDVCANKFDKTDLPPVGDWLAALSRVGCYGVSIKGVMDALDIGARSNEFDPWRDTVMQLPAWDGVERLDMFFSAYAEVEPSEALTLTTRLLFAGVLMRQLHPGITCPVTPVLIGPQGCGKSYFVTQVARALNAPDPAALTFGDAIRMSDAAGRSVVAELAEMSGLGKKDNEAVKAWLTDDVDIYRKAYAPTAESHMRRFVPIGTANQHELNRDASGNRRLMPVIIPLRIDPTWTREAIQLFAEAKARFCDDREKYFELCRDSARAVLEHNGRDMRKDVGTQICDLDDLMPPILRSKLAGGRVRSSDIRTALDALPSGRQQHMRAVSQWLTIRGWTRGTDGATRHYTAPKDFLDNDDTEALLFPLNPFTADQQVTH